MQHGSGDRAIGRRADGTPPAGPRHLSGAAHLARRRRASRLGRCQQAPQRASHRHL